MPSLEESEINTILLLIVPLDTLKSTCHLVSLNIYALVSCKKFSDGIHMCLIGCRCADDKPYAPSSRVSQEKAKSLGIHFTPLEVSLKDTVESLKEKNFVSF